VETGTAGVRGTVSLAATSEGLPRQIKLMAGNPVSGETEVTLPGTDGAEYYVDSLPAGPCRVVVEEYDANNRAREAQVMPLPDLVAGEVTEVELVVE